MTVNDWSREISDPNRTLSTPLLCEYFAAGAVDREPGDSHPVQVEPEPGEVLARDTREHRAPGEVVAHDLVAEIEVVVGDVVRRVAVTWCVVIDVGATAHLTGSSASSSIQGPIGLPIQRVLSGTDSPLITSDTGPTVA